MYIKGSLISISLSILFLILFLIFYDYNYNYTKKYKKVLSFIVLYTYIPVLFMIFLF